jgi:hypothetical protein
MTTKDENTLLHNTKIKNILLLAKRQVATKPNNRMEEKDVEVWPSQTYEEEDPAERFDRQLVLAAQQESRILFLDETYNGQEKKHESNTSAKKMDPQIIEEYCRAVDITPKKCGLEPFVIVNETNYMFELWQWLERANKCDVSVTHSGFFDLVCSAIRIVLQNIRLHDEKWVKFLEFIVTTEVFGWTGSQFNSALTESKMKTLVKKLDDIVNHGDLFYLPKELGIIPWASPTTATSTTTSNQKSTTPPSRYLTGTFGPVEPRGPMGTSGLVNEPHNHILWHLARQKSGGGDTQQHLEKMTVVLNRKHKRHAVDEKETEEWEEKKQRLHQALSSQLFQIGFHSEEGQVSAYCSATVPTKQAAAIEMD